MILALLLAAATVAPTTITTSTPLTESQATLLPGWLSDLNAGLCAQAQLQPPCTTEQLQERAQRKDVRIFATLDEWASEVVSQATKAAAQQQAQKLRSLAEGDAVALKEAARHELGLGGTP